MSAFLKQTQRVDVNDIKVEDRQRGSIEDEELRILADSLKRIGLIHPIVLDKDNRLISGGRRLAAAKALGWTQIDVRYNNTTDPQEKQIIELEENLKRTDLEWQDRVQAIQKIHNAYLSIDPHWTMEKTGAAIGLALSKVSEYIAIADEMAQGNSQIAQATKLSEAKTAIKRTRARELENMSRTLFQGAKGAQAQGQTIKDLPADKPVWCGDFLEWAQTPQQERFSVIHCDFPYGVGMHKSGQVSKALGSYEDTPDLYFQLLSGFVKHYANFALPISHIMFWFSMNFYTETKAALGQIPNSRVFPFPLIWDKDGRGMLPDPMREGRRVYETAFLVSVGDRKLVKPVANLKSHPLDETRDHVSRKPPQVVQHFLQMLVEPGVRLLDPTCGSGSALVAGRALGAEVFGVEMNPEYVAGIKL